MKKESTSEDFGQLEYSQISLIIRLYVGLSGTSNKFQMGFPVLWQKGTF